jgi:hypothetical protein
MGERTMKAIALLITSPFMITFLLGGLQTIEYNIMTGGSIPLQAYIIIVAFGIWLFAMKKTGKYDFLRGCVKIKHFLFSLFLG